MSIPDYSRLRANCSEITYALSASQGSQLLDLYATSDGQVHYQGTWMGKGSKALDKSFRWLRLDFSNTDLSKAMEHIIHVQFSHAIRHLYWLRTSLIVYHVRAIEKETGLARNGQLLETFKTHLKQHSAVTSLNDECVQLFQDEISQASSAVDLGATRNAVVKFYSAVDIFWSIILLDQYRSLRKPLLPYLKQEDAIFLDQRLYISLSKMCMTAFLEGLLQQPIPVTILAKVICDKMLTSSETTALNAWILGLNQHQARISIRQFECILKEIAQMIGLATGVTSVYDKLLLLLDRKNCQIMFNEDPDHLDWRDGLKPGDSLICHGLTYHLGEQLSPLNFVDDKNKIFALAETKDFVVKISYNRFQLKIEDLKKSDPKEHFGVHPVVTGLAGCDPNGVFVILERLENNLAQYAWTSRSAELDQKDRTIALILASHLVCWQQAQVSLPTLSLKHLMFAKNGVLKSLSLLKKEKADYNEWENFCYQVSNHNEYVLQYLMRVSKLYDHKMAKFYRTALVHSLERGEATGPYPAGNWEAKYLNRIKELRASSLVLCQDVFRFVVEHLKKAGVYKNAQAPAIRKAIYYKLSALYAVSPTAGIISPILVDKLKIEFQQEKQTAQAFEKKLIGIFEYHEEYFTKQFNELMKKNRSAKAKQMLLLSS